MAIIAFYDPRHPPVSGRNSIYVAQLGAVFLESIDGKGKVTARFIHAVAKDPIDSDQDCMLKTTRMVLDSSRGG